MARDDGRARGRVVRLLCTVPHHVTSAELYPTHGVILASSQKYSRCKKQPDSGIADGLQQ